MYIIGLPIHSFIPDIYIAPLQETYLEALSVQLRPKRNILRSLQEEGMLFRGSKRSVRWSSFQVEGPITEKVRPCLRAERARGTKSSPRAEERRAGREARSETGLQRSVKYDGFFGILLFLVPCTFLWFSTLHVSMYVPLAFPSSWFHVRSFGLPSSWFDVRSYGLPLFLVPCT